MQKYNLKSTWCKNKIFHYRAVDLIPMCILSIRLTVHTKKIVPEDFSGTILHYFHTTTVFQYAFCILHFLPQLS